MKKLFYNDKVIIFDANYQKYNDKDFLLIENPAPEAILEVIINEKAFVNMVVISNNPQLAYENFVRGFKDVVAAGGVIQREDGDMLFIYRRGVWDLPKGKQDDGESVEECALREIKEETGIQKVVITNTAPFVTQHFYNTYGDWELKTTYWFTMHGEGDFIKSNHQLEEGIENYCWVSRDRAIEVAKNSYSTIYEVVKVLIEGK